MKTRLWIMGVIGLALVAAAAWVVAGLRRRLEPRNLDAPRNALVVIQPYRYAGTWVFDDPKTGLLREPFVAGIPEMIDGLIAGVTNAEQGFRLTFSAAPFPGYGTRLRWRRADMNGNWYYCEKTGTEGWLCPAMLRYYAKPPPEIYVKAEAR